MQPKSLQKCQIKSELLHFKKLLQVTGLTKDQELIIRIFELGDEPHVTRSLIRGWRETKNDRRSSNMPDDMLNAFFQGLFEYRDIKNKEGIQVFNFGKSRLK